MKLIFLGPPGAGKGTMAVKAKEILSIPHISTGDLFRTAIKNETELGLKVKSIMAKGDLVPDEVTTAMVKERINEDDCKNGFILDGFPRTIPQAEALDKLTTIDSVINFTLNDKRIIKRLSGRRMCKNCGTGYHIEYLPPAKEGICDKCDGELYTRDDDQIDSIKNRLTVYTDSTEPLIEYYKSKNILKDIDASVSPEEVLKNLMTTLK